MKGRQWATVLKKRSISRTWCIFRVPVTLSLDLCGFVHTNKRSQRITYPFVNFILCELKLIVVPHACNSIIRRQRQEHQEFNTCLTTWEVLGQPWAPWQHHVSKITTVCTLNHSVPWNSVCGGSGAGTEDDVGPPVLSLSTLFPETGLSLTLYSWAGGQKPQLRPEGLRVLSTLVGDLSSISSTHVVVQLQGMGCLWMSSCDVFSCPLQTQTWYTHTCR